jgi:hypothetical protein
MDFIQMALGCRLGHELPYAFVKAAISYQVGTGTKGSASPFAFE